jgi:hypothetical protein
MQVAFQQEKSVRRRFIVLIIFLSCALVYLCLQVQRLRAEVRNAKAEKRGAASSFMAEWKKAWGHHLESLGGRNDFRGGYQFDGGVTVRVGLHWCAFDCEEMMSHGARKAIIEKIAASVVQLAFNEAEEIEKQWQLFSALSQAGSREKHFSLAWAEVSFYCHNNASTIEIRDRNSPTFEH